jgi:glutathione S-transferase
MSYTLYYSPGTASFVVHWALIEIGAPFELALVDFDSNAQKAPAYLKINPSGHVPALVIDGTAYAETAALLMLLAERHPQKALAPLPGAPERAAYLQWMIYFANTLQPAFRLWFYSDEGAGPENVEATRAQARSRIEKAWDRVDALLADGRPYLLGAKIGMADFLGTMLMRWSRNMPRPATGWPHINAYVLRMRAMPSYRATHDREGLTDWI